MQTNLKLKMADFNIGNCLLNGLYSNYFADSGWFGS